MNRENELKLPSKYEQPVLKKILQDKNDQFLVHIQLF